MVVPLLGMHSVPGNNVRSILATILPPKEKIDEDCAIAVNS